MVSEQAWNLFMNLINVSETEVSVEHLNLIFEYERCNKRLSSRKCLGAALPVNLRAQNKNKPASGKPLKVNILMLVNKVNII